MTVIEGTAFARAGLLGNPSDGYGGKVLAAAVRNFAARVRLEESPAYKESIFTFAPDSSGAAEYYSLSEEVMERA